MNQKVEHRPKEDHQNLRNQGRAASLRGWNKILLYVDFLECPNEALLYAAACSRQMGAELTLLHVVEPYPPIPQMDPVDVELVQEADETLERMRNGLADIAVLKSILRTGEAHTEIVNTASELGIDLIILSTRRRSKLRQLLLGSTAERVLRDAICPVLIFPERERGVYDRPLDR